MSQIDQINKTMGLLSQALNVAGGCLNQQPVSSAKSDIRRAIEKLESVKNDNVKKEIQKETNHQKWWGHIKNGVTIASSPKTSMRTLKELNKLIADEQKKIDNIEDKVIKADQVKILKD